MAKEKERFSCSLPTTVISSLSDLAAKKGQTISYIMTGYTINGLANDTALTVSERYMWNLTRITETITRLLEIAKIHNFNGGIKESMLLLSSLLLLRDGYFESSTSYSRFRYSYFEVLDELTKIDKPLVDEITYLIRNIKIELPVIDEISIAIKDSLNELKSSEYSEEVLILRTCRNQEVSQ